MDSHATHRPASTADAFDVARWRAPEPRRHDWSAANDARSSDFTEADAWSWRDLPDWVTIAAGAAVAAIMGALMGGALHI